MITYQRIVRLLQNGYYIQEEKWEKPDIKTYSVNKRESKDTITTAYQIPKNVVNKLVKEENAILKRAKRISLALNFTPYNPSKNCAIYWTN